ncbi:MAG: MBG domain-containing protein [Acidobacteriaceae bacterium]
MNAISGRRNAGSSASRLPLFHRNSSRWTLPVLVLLAFLCGMSAAHAQTTAYYAGVTSTVDTTLAAPDGIATDAIAGGPGNLFVADDSTNTVYELTRTGPSAYSAPAPLPNPTPGYVFLRGVAIDSNGNLWVADNANGSGGQVYELAYNSATKVFAAPAKIGSGWQGPWAIAADKSGNVFVTDNTANTITEITAGTLGTPITGVSQPRGIAIDSSEDIFAVDGNASQVKELTSASSYATLNTVSPGFQGPGDISFDASGNLWVSEFSTNSARELTGWNSYDSSFTTVQYWGSGLNGPVAVWPSADGTMIVSNQGVGAIEEINFQQPLSLGAAAVSSTSSTSQTVTFAFTASTVIGTPLVVAQGGTGQDFVNAGSGSCTAGTHAQFSSCTVDVKFAPKTPGNRAGAVTLVDGSGNELAQAFLSGTATGPQVVFSPGKGTTPLGTFSTPQKVAVDGSGNVFVVDSSANTITEILAAGGTQSIAPAGLSLSVPYSIAIDGAGNLFLGESGNNSIDEIYAPSYTTWTELPGAYTPLGLAIDNNGNLFVADPPAVRELTAASGYGTVITLDSSFGLPYAVAVDTSGNVWVADQGNGSTPSVTELSPTGTVLNTFTSFNSPEGVAVDPGGDVYVADNGGGAVTELPASNYANPVTLASGLSAPAGIALDNSGNVYYSTNGSDNSIYKIDLADPGSLSFTTPTPYQTLSSDSPQSISLTNIGNASLNLSNIVVATTSGSTANSFALATGSGDCTTTSSLASGAGCNVSINYTPESVGTAIAGTATVTDNVSTSPQVINLSGVAGTQATATVVGQNATSAYSASAQDVTLTATVTAPGVADVNEGTVAFTVQGTTGGTVASPTVVNGAASVTYVIPAGQAAGPYTIQAAYTDASGNFGSSTDTTHTLTIGLANQSTLTVNATSPAAYNSTQTLTTTGGNGTGTVTYSVGASTACSVTGATLTISSGTGTCAVTATKAADANYNAVTSAAATVTVQTAAQATLTVNATSPAAYNTTQTLTTTGGNGTGTVTYSVGGSTACSVTGTTLTITSGTGSCSVTASKAADNNYSIANSAPVTVTVQMINQAALTAHVTSPATYNTTQTLTATGGSGTGAVTYSAGGSTACSVTGTTLTITSGTGNCSVTASKAADANYNLVTSAAATVTVQTATQATLTVNASSPAAYNSTQTLTTTGGNGTGVVTYSVGGSTACSVTGATLTITSGTGTCAVIATKAADANYNLATSAAATVTVQTAAQGTLTVNATSPAVYNSTQTLTTTGGNGTGAVTYSVGGSTACSVTGATLTITSGTGTCSVTATKAADNNYSLVTSAPATVTVTGATLTITVNAASRLYGAANPTFTGTIVGLQNGDTVTPAYSTTATVTSPVGPYPITATISGPKAANYTLTVNQGTLTISKAPLTITVNNATRIYNTANPTFTGTVNGLVAGDTLTTVVPSYSTTATLTSPVGTYPITATISGTSAGNYTPTVTAGTLTITQATATVTWTAPAAIIYGTPLSATQLDATANVGGTFTYTPAAGAILPVGAGQTLSVSFTPTDSTDYKSSTGATAITVAATGLTVSANNATRVYGAANLTFTGTITGAQGGDAFTESFTTAASITSNVGTYPIVPSASGPNLANYTVVINDGTLTISKANTTTGLSASGSSVNPGATVTLTATVASATSGTPTGSVSFYDGTALLGSGTLSGGVATYATTTLAPGSSNTITAVYSGDSNFNSSTASTSTGITVGVLDFTLGTPTPATQSGRAGASFQYSFNVSPLYGSYAGTVNFAATGLPSGAVATFSPSSIAADGGAQTVTMSVSTASANAALVHPSTAGRGLIPAALAFLLLPLAGTKRMRREGRRFGRLACLLLLVLGGLGATAVLTGCGAHAGSTNSTVGYTITITATSGSIQHTSTVSLDLQ